MPKTLRLSLALAALAASLSLCAGAQAAIVTVGSTATPSASATIGNPATIINASLGSPGSLLTSPVSGTIIRWHVTGFIGGPFRLRVLTPLGGVNYAGSGTSAPEIPTSIATQTFATNLPIKAGQMLAVDNAKGSDQEGYFVTPAGSYAFFVPPLADGASGTAVGPFPGIEFTFNAEVLPPPTIATIAPASGSLKGGSVVSIFGSNFAEVKAVSFGGVPAISYAVTSDSLITAVAPPSATLGPLPVSVTTVSGSVSSPFAYTGCKVPKLAGRKLKGAKKGIRKAGCKVGKVTKEDGVTAKTGTVVKQAPKPGKLLAPGARVSFKLG